jgi:signal peptidase I
LIVTTAISETLMQRNSTDRTMMGLSPAAKRDLPDRPEVSRASVIRQTVELIVLLCVCVVLVRTFSAEAYVVPTGSMAPTLLGWHRELTCPGCGSMFVLGVDEEGPSGQAVCPNCGERNQENASSFECGGDRVLVEKFLYEIRRPRRWEVAVFHFPGDPTQAYVKRVVGLPGESIRISDGDVFANGLILRKSLAELRAMKILVHDSRFSPKDADRFPRWLFRRGDRWGPLESGWKSDNGKFVHDAPEPSSSRPVDDWLVYKHWDPAKGRYGPICDFYAYNGSEPRAGNEINDVGMEASMRVSDSVEAVSLALRSGPDQFLLRIPVTASGSISLTRNQRPVSLTNCYNPFKGNALWPQTVRVEAVVMDRRVQVAIDGQPVFDPFDYDVQKSGSGSNESPIAVGARGGSLEVSDLRIYRDIYYTGNLANTPRFPHGMRSAVSLGSDDYFVLGDNSPVSNDSRFWSEGPIVRGSMFVGKPFLVHLPGQLVPLKVFGRSVCWVPDPRRIRYIR